jgi:uncharacterized membrane protein
MTPTTPSLARPKRTRHKPEDVAQHLMGVPYADLDGRAQKVARHVAERTHITRQVHGEPSGDVPGDIPGDLPGEERARPSAGQAAADAVALFGGSWVFVGLFAVATLGWVGVNVLLLALKGRTFDPYPFILLNLFLSMLAAVQAPIILMSQNRQAEKDRQSAAHDYEVNLKAELEIMLLHDKLDALRDQQWNELLRIQERQIELLLAMAKPKPASEP